MRGSTVLSAMTVLWSATSAAPVRNWTPADGWEGINYETFDWSSVPFNKADWHQVDWSRVPYNSFPWHRFTCGNAGRRQWLSALKSFTSVYNVVGTPDEVVNGTAPGPFTLTGGLPGALGDFQYGLLSDQNVICWNIEVTGFRGDYVSPARTATHIHQAARGATGPPRLAFPNPVVVTSDSLERRVSVGCQKGPFTTGVLQNGTDTGFSFTIDKIELNPENFFTDIHSSLARPGAVRAQLA
ncbi:hypothetical protein TruAng_009062 [Truncatella angustata]|nr:hypothetical protein TruAng_009062 [Truncatella angustata]